ncbi:hypothetical protein HYT55_01050 [Candidatus Woesearchaeota archaeon]|nr:hypothetical protein [Candidatus Woesearchaeota archaeon]
MSAVLERTIDALYREEERTQNPSKLRLVTENDNREKNKKESTLTLLLEDAGPAANDDRELKPEETSIEYGFPEELLMQGLYGESLHYQMSGPYQVQKPIYAADGEDEEKPQGWILEKQEAETMTREEAEEAIAEVQYAAAGGIPGEVDSRTRERLATYFLFDPSLARLMVRSHWVTDEVDYSKKF